MTFAPALTWMHLFPGSSAYECRRGPQWFCDLLRAVPKEGGPNVRIAFEQDFSGCANPVADDEGLVAINSKGLNPAGLAAAGFHYVRRFAAIPNIEAARWFVPIDSGSVSSAAFKLYSPTRASARLKQSAIQALARTGMPLWYRDQVWVVQREKPPLEQLLADAFVGTPLRVALSAGAPEPARNRKASAAVIGLDGRLLAFAKISGSPLARRLLEHEASILSQLDRNAALRGCVPRLIASGDVDNRFVLIQSPVSGKAAPPRLTPTHRAFLNALESPRVKPAAATALVSNLAPRIAAAGANAAALRQPLQQALAALTGCMAPSTCVHGDFAPWNLRRGHNLLSSFDWEYGEMDGLPLIDETHHELQVGYLLNGWTVERADQRLRELSTTQQRFTPAHAAALQNVYLIDIMTRLAEEGYDSADPMVAWTRLLLDRRISGFPALEAAA